MSESREVDLNSNGGKYLVVARRYRPLMFDQLVGQSAVTKALINAIETNRVGHAYLFTGARGVGKTSTARIFAKALNAPEGATATPDNTSDICQAIDAGEDIDVLEIDGASNRGIDEIRQLRAGVGMRPSRARYKIYIIDEVHMLTQQAFNALLKTLEEPPEHVKFIFCTTDPEKIPITVLSRCQRFDFAPIETDEILGKLEEIVRAENANADPEALRLLARRAGGSMRDSQSLLEQILSFSNERITVDHVHAMLGTADDARLSAMADDLIAHDAAAVLRKVDEAFMAGIEAGQLAEQLLGYFRDVMAAAVGCGVEMLRHAAPSSYDLLTERGKQLGIPAILAIVGIMDNTILRMRQSVHGRVLLESAMVQICQLGDLQAISNVVAGLTGSDSSPRSIQKKNSNASGRVVDPGPATRPQTSHVDGSATPPPPPPSVSQSPAASQSLSRTERQETPHRSTEHASSDLRWDAAHVERIWHGAIELLDDMTANHARNAQRVEPAGDGKIRVVFPGDRQLDKVSCEKPDRKSKMEAALAKAANRQVQYQCVLNANDVKPQSTRRVLRSSDRAKRLREIEQEPIVQRLMELFQGEVLRIDQPGDD